MDVTAALLAGLGLGAFVAAQVGPVSLLCVRTATRHGFRPGVAIGIGAALVDFGYAALGVLGAAALLRGEAVQLGLGLLGAVVLVVMGVRTLHAAFRIRLGGEDDVEVVRPGAALRTGVVATASNPLTIVSWAAIFGAASTASLVATATDAAALLLGVGLGSAGWFVFLALAASRAGSRMGDRSLRVVDVVAGVGLVGFGVALGVRSVSQSDVAA